MSAQQATDMRYGRRGGGWAADPAGSPRPRPCDVCRMPMHGRQRDRHHMCDPETLAGMTCTCPPGCTTGNTWGDGPRDCHPKCEPCRLMAGRPYKG